MKTRNKILISVLLSMAIGFASCRKKPPVPSSPVLGTCTVDLDANLNVVRNQEALIGNLITDAVYYDLKNKGKNVDAALVNGGNIRFSASQRPDGIYKAGSITNKMVDEMLPFGDASVIVTLNGIQLKEVLERSCAQLPLSMGPFMQVSKELKVNIDITKQSQVLNIEETAITTAGQRVTSISINGINIDSISEYRIIFPSYIADGFDGYVTLLNLPSNKKENLVENQALAVKEYISIHSPVTPVQESRITFQ